MCIRDRSQFMCLLCQVLTFFLFQCGSDKKYGIRTDNLDVYKRQVNTQLEFCYFILFISIYFPFLNGQNDVIHIIISI